MNETTSKIITFILQPEFTGVLYYIRAVFLSVSAILFVAIVFLFLKTSWFKDRFLENTKEILTYSPLKEGKFKKEWKSILEKFNTGIEGEQKMAIIKADEMLNDVLEKLDFKGDFIVEKLRTMTSENLKNIDDVWQAHKIRDNIVYDPDYKLPLQESKKAIDAYMAAFQNLDVI
ncbi:MAG: hypothetical protein PHH17_00125 [Candidatus Pacebacteria bacterium]|nr:hypothetical protein [Candidatus Paceibacterota bacterium]MDD3072107.1 hypothetical protein [Candidatus Paceibacterota bacterium]MDD3728828.1 hypothetical protein [Candidatus Paceibacterota bacterium]MDD4201313.1 hypothetical protein [Candidatus Paceibacterota bacterium]MDD4466985.1 hypothetical protein [Candidatus Paceibacterota bacterium]